MVFYQVIDLPFGETATNGSYVVSVSASSLAHPQPYALVISGPLTPLSASPHTPPATVNEDDQSLSKEIIIYICALSVGIALLLSCICYFRSMTTKSIFLDPWTFDSRSHSQDRDDRPRKKRTRNRASPGDYI